MDMTRRRVLTGAAAGVGAAATPAAAEAARGRHRHHREYVVTDAYVLSMDPAIGDIAVGDVHVRDGEIVAVGPDLGARGARIDGRGMVVMPGLVDTHWHLWTTLYRSMSSSSPETAYFALNVANGVRCLPTDLFQGTRLGLVDALNTGITTVHDWAHNLRSPEHVDGNLRAHKEVGLRGRFSYGTRQGQPGTELLDLDDVARVEREWFDGHRLPLMHLGLAGRPPGLVGEEVFRPEYDFAQDARPAGQLPRQLDPGPGRRSR